MFKPRRDAIGDDMTTSHRNPEYEARYEEHPHYWVILTVLLIVGLLLTGCCGVPATYLKADRAALDTIGRDFAKYVEADDALPDVLKAMKLAVVEAWRVRVVEAEKEAGE